MAGIKILGTRHYSPHFIVTNDDMATIVETSDEWIRTRTGIERRRFSLDEPAWYMGEQASRRAMEMAGVTGDDIDMIICTTVTHDADFPSAACFIQNALEIKDAMAFDISVACAGLTYSLDMARRYVATGDVKTVLVVSAERLSQVTNFEDRATCVLTGDGAGALVVTGDPEAPFASYLQSDPTGGQYLYSMHSKNKVPFGNPSELDTHQQFERAWDNLMYMNGQAVYKFATKAMPLAIREVCARMNLEPEDLDLIIPHQANLRIIETAAKNLDISMDKIYVNIHEYGNCSSATIPIGLDECVRSGRLKRGDTVCIVGFGAGLVYGANVFTY